MENLPKDQTVEEKKTDSEIEQEDGYVKISVLNDNMEAKMRVVSPKHGGEEAKYEDAMSELEKQKIVFGVDEKKISDIFENGIVNKDITIARGDTPINGINGDLQYFIKNLSKVKPEEDEKGNVDFKNIGFIQSIKNGEKIAKKIPPQEGVDGKDILGRLILAKKGKEFLLPRGRNTMSDPSDPNLLLASIDGCIIFKGKDIDVSPVFIVHENVDFKTGNIDYLGTLIIKGDIKSGFKVKVTGNMEVWGVVEDADIEVSGKILIKKGFLGSGKGTIKAKGDVILKFCENQKIFSEGNVTVEALLHSEVESYKKVIVKGSKGLIVGGSVMALEGIEAKTAGNIHYAKTELMVGVKNETRIKLEEISLNLLKNEENQQNLKNAIVAIVKADNTKGGISEEKKKLMRRMQEIINSVPQAQAQLNAQKDELERELEEYNQVRVKVKDKLFPGVKIYIQNKKTSIKQETSGAEFGIEANEIHQFPLSKE